METKNKNNRCFAQARCSLTELCNIFDEAFLVDVSIVKPTQTVEKGHFPLLILFDQI